MKTLMLPHKAGKGFFVIFSILAVIMLAGGISLAGEKYKAEGLFLEGCNCSQPCNAEITNDNTDCETIGFMEFSGGEFMQVELEDAKIAYAGKRGEWVRIYVQSKNPVQREAAIAFAKGYLTNFGTVESATEAKITIEGGDGEYTARVNDGNTITLTTQPVIGGDNKNPVRYVNARGRLNREFLQGRTVLGTLNDAERKFEIRDANAIFNPDMDSSGELK